jgi:hypothetical protein
VRARYKTLAAAVALERFTVADLVRYSGIKRTTVQSVVQRAGRYIDSVDELRTGKRGGRPKVYRVRPERADELLATLQEIEESFADSEPRTSSGDDGLAAVAIARNALVRVRDSTEDAERERLVELARASLEDVDTVAPGSRLLCALSWRRACAILTNPSRRDYQHVATESGIAPDDVVDTTNLPTAPQLCTLVGYMPDGRERLLVYSDLLTVLPTGYLYNPGRTIWPDVVTEVIADTNTSNQLEKMATILENNLEKSPYWSDSALIGQTAHIIYQMALDQRDRDETVLARSDEVRRDLLSLAGVHLAQDAA